MESQAVFQAKTKAKKILLNCHPAGRGTAIYARATDAYAATAAAAATTTATDATETARTDSTSAAATRSVHFSSPGKQLPAEEQLRISGAAASPNATRAQSAAAAAAAATEILELRRVGDERAAVFG